MSKHTEESWVNGYGNGITGPTTPSGHPTCQESVNWNTYSREWDRVGEAAKYPDSEHTIVSCGKETIAIIPLNGVGGRVAGERHAQLISDAPDLLAACRQLVAFADEVLPQAGSLCFDVGNLNDALCTARPIIAANAEDAA